MGSRAKGSLGWAHVVVGALLLLGASAGALAQHCAAPAARVVSIQGSVELRQQISQRWQAAQSGIPICNGDSVRVGPRSRAALLLPNETTLRLDQDTTLTLSAPDQAQASLLDLILGTIHVISRTPRPFRVNTPYLNAGVEGTEFLVGSDEAGARLAVFEGRVSATSAEGALMLVGGEIAYAAKGAPLRKERMLRPADAVQWALYYPTLFDHRLGEQITGTAGEAALRESIALYRQDRLAEAIFRLDKAPDGLANPRFLTYRAGLLLLVGRADEARSDIERALAVDAGNSNAHALKSVVALTQNDKDQALKLATQAVELDQASPVARLALSYAQQAHFKIEEALASVQKAVDLDPQNALAWARLAELHMSTGYLDRALEAAKRAVSLNPELAKTQSVLGFANLTRIDTQAAKQAFQKAIDLDQADPLPRLGLGLAMIREGELTAGREQLEIAVCLDPENSLLRSYVGKAYYEEKRDKLAGIQFDLAKERDPRDPTPWFYDAIRKQTLNQPVEALEGLNKSIALNDNRAIFRSQLGLDRDLATRTSSVARIYRDLGFDRLATIEAARALLYDQTDYSPHRLLAEAYAGVPHRDVARASELLQSQIRQPINFAPVQPELSDDRGGDATKAGILRGASPGLVGTNEFSPLFDRDGASVLAEALVGSRSTFGHQLIASANWRTMSMSAGELHFQTDGSDVNADLKKDLYSFFVQASVHPSASVQLEYRHLDSEGGLTLVPFDPANATRSRLSDRRDNLRVGLSYSISPRSGLLFSGIYQSRSQLQLFPELDFAQTIETDSRSGEAQYYWRGVRTEAVAGFWHFRGEDRVAVPGSGEDLAKSSHDSGYAYGTWRLPPYLYLQAGLATERLWNPPVRRHVVNPKLGVVWNFDADTALRAAAMRTLKRQLVANQTLEPTNLAGFNQFFDDFNGTLALVHGVGMDRRFGTDLYAGIELSRRAVKVPVSNVLSSTFRDIDWRERAANAYVYWIVPKGWATAFSPSWNVAVALAPTYEHLMRSDQLVDSAGILDLKTRLIPVSLSLIDARGLSFKVTSTYVRQDGTLTAFPEADRFPVSERFWNWDASLTYRLAARRGLLSFGVRNLTDRHSRFQESDSVNPLFSTRRFAFCKVILSF